MADTDQVLNLAAIIREVNGNNRKGAAALAESILDHPRFRAAALADGPAVPDGREPASVTGQPSDEDLLGIACQSIEPYDKIRPGEYEAENECAIEVYGSELVTFARAVLARWGNPAPQPPAEGEVVELVAWLYEQLHVCLQAPWTPGIKHFGRAADLLQHLSPPQPVPVSERPWEREGWCDKRGMCWAWNWGICNWWEWVDSKLISYSSGDYTHCLPAHALPIPHQQESIND